MRVDTPRIAANSLAVTRAFPTAGAGGVVRTGFSARVFAAYDEAWEQEAGDDDLQPLIDFLDFVNNASDEEFAVLMEDIASPEDACHTARRVIEEADRHVATALFGARALEAVCRLRLLRYLILPFTRV